jgi:hypothetical protein
MPLFHGQRDASLVHKLNTELIVDIIDTEVALYKLSLEQTKTNMYDESDKKIYNLPIKISAIINRQPQAYEGTEFGQDFTQTCDFGFIRELLKEVETYVEVGDVIEYNGEYWEIDAIQENQYFGGKNPDYSFATERWGHNVSIIANTHLTRRSRINIEQVRSAPRSSEYNDLPDNI